MNNITELRNELSVVFQALKNGELDHKTADVLNNTAGKMIISSKVQMEYQSRTKEKDDISIKFLDSE